MHPFPSGTMVTTDMEYFDRFGRVVVGVSVDVPDLPHRYTAVRWIYQVGNVIPEHQGNVVIMMTKDLTECSYI